MTNDNVVSIGEKGGMPGGTGGSGGDIDDRLRALEIQMARIEVQVANLANNVATQNDLSKLKNWILTGLVGALGASGIILAIVDRILGRIPG